MNPAKLNEAFSKLVKENNILMEGMDKMPTVSHEVVLGGKGSVPGQVSDKSTKNAAGADNKDMQKVDSSVVKGSGSTPNDKAADTIKNNSNTKDPVPTVPADVSYGTKVVINSKYKMNKENFDVSSDINSLFEGSEMSEELKTKASVVFEAVIKDKIETELKEIKKDLEEQYTNEFQKNIATLSESVDQSVQYGITKWMDDNSLSITNSIQSQITQDFMHDLKKVFEAHNIMIPESKNDLVEEMAEKIDELTAKLDEEIENNMKMKKKMKEKDKDETVEKVSEGMSENQKDKIKRLAESITYDTKETFEEKLNSLKEFIVRTPKENTKTETLLEEAEPTQQNSTNNSAIDFYSSNGWI